jgi:hypothetical protein
MGYAGNGMYWNNYPGLLSGISGYAAVSTATGSPVGTPEVPANDLKVGGGPSQAEIPDYGGTAAY